MAPHMFIGPLGDLELKNVCINVLWYVLYACSIVLL